MEVPAGLERSVAKTAAMPLVEIWPAEEELPTWARTLTPGDDGGEQKHVYSGACRIQPMLHGCLYLSTNTSFTRSHLCAPAAPDCLQLLRWEDRAAHRLQFSVVTSNPDAGPGRLPPGGGSLLFNAASARAIRSISLGNLVAQPNVRFKISPAFLLWTPNSGAFSTCFPHTKMWSVAHAFGKTCLPSRLEFKVCSSSRLFEVNFEVLAKAERAALHLHFCILKRRITRQNNYLWHFCIQRFVSLSQKV